MTCACYGPGELLGAGHMAQQRALYAESRKNCTEHGQCLIVGCTRPRAEGDRSLCAPHRYWCNYVLARPFYRDHEPPEPDETGAIQEPLEALL